MRNTKMGVLLLLWLLAVIPRSTYAEPIATKNTENPAVDAMVGVTKSLTEAIEWMKDNMVDNAAFDEAIDNVEKQIAKLPDEARKAHKEILQEIHTARTRIVGTRTYLEKIAKELKSQCEKLIALYNRNDVTVELIGYSVTRFVKLVRATKALLQEASEMYVKTKGDLLGVNNMLGKYVVQVEIKEANHSAHTAGQEAYFTKVYWIVGVTTLGLGLIIGAPIMESQRSELYRIRDELKKSVAAVQAIMDVLSDKLDTMNKYIADEIDLIDEWKVQLEISLSDHQDGITNNDLKYAKDDILANLNDLKKACVNYLSHGMMIH